MQRIKARLYWLDVQPASTRHQRCPDAPKPSTFPRILTQVMSEVVFVGIASAAATLLAAVLTAYREELASLVRGRRALRTFGGRWTGQNVPIQTFDSSEPLDAIKYELNAHIKQSGRSLKGHVSVTRPGGETYIEAFTGEIVSDSCACVIFYSNDRDVSDYGTAMLQLDGYGTNIAGYVLGNRTAGHGFVLSNIVLRKTFRD